MTIEGVICHPKSRRLCFFSLCCLLREAEASVPIFRNGHVVPGQEARSVDCQQQPHSKKDGSHHQWGDSVLAVAVGMDKVSFSLSANASWEVGGGKRWRGIGRGLDVLWKNWGGSVERSSSHVKELLQQWIVFSQVEKRKGCFRGIMKTACSPDLLYLTITHRPEGTW